MNTVAEKLSQLANVERNIALFDKAVGPDGVKQKLFVEHPAVVSDQYGKQVEHLRGERDALAFSAQRFLFRGEIKLPK